jgi:ribosome maturation factor RimP
MIEKSIIEELVAQYMIDNGLELVEVKVNKANNIKVFFDAPGRSVNIDDCVKLSRFIESGLDRDKEDFSLMVSSSGKEKNINEE